MRRAISWRRNATEHSLFRVIGSYPPPKAWQTAGQQVCLIEFLTKPLPCR